MGGGSNNGNVNSNKENLKMIRRIYFLFVSIIVTTFLFAGCTGGPSRKHIEQLIREYVNQNQFPIHLFPRKEYLNAKYKPTEKKLEELKIIKVTKAQGIDEWKVDVYVKISAILEPRPAPGADWLRAYDHYKVPTSSKRIEGVGEHQYFIREDSYGEFYVSDFPSFIRF